jgi:hypothetical protein
MPCNKQALPSKAISCVSQQSSGYPIIHSHANFLIHTQVQEAEFVAHVFIPTASRDDVDPAGSISGSIKNDQVAGGACVRMKYISEIQLLLEGFQHESFKLADWVISLSPMLCVPMLGKFGIHSGSVTYTCTYG